MQTVILGVMFFLVLRELFRLTPTTVAFVCIVGSCVLTLILSTYAFHLLFDWSING